MGELLLPRQLVCRLIAQPPPNPISQEKYEKPAPDTTHGAEVSDTKHMLSHCSLTIQT